MPLATLAVPTKYLCELPCSDVNYFSTVFFMSVWRRWCLTRKILTRRYDKRAVWTASDIPRRWDPRRTSLQDSACSSADPLLWTARDSMSPGHWHKRKKLYDLKHIFEFANWALLDGFFFSLLQTFKLTWEGQSVSQSRPRKDQYEDVQLWKINKGFELKLLYKIDFSQFFFSSWITHHSENNTAAKPEHHTPVAKNVKVPAWDMECVIR